MISNRMYSCREMAYDRGMTKIMNLIDIFDKRTDKKIVKYLGEKYLKENMKKLINDEIRCDSMYEKRILLKQLNDGMHDNHHIQLFLDNVTNQVPNHYNQTNNLGHVNDDNDFDIYYEAEITKPDSDYMYSYKKKNQFKKKTPEIDSDDESFSLRNLKSISTNSLVSGDLKKDAFQTKNETGRRKVFKKLSQNILDRIKEVQEPKKTLPNNNNEKSLKYKGFKIDMKLKKPLVDARPISSLSISSNSTKYSNSRKNNNTVETINLNFNTEIEIKNISRLEYSHQKSNENKADKKIRSKSGLPNLRRAESSQKSVVSQLDVYNSSSEIFSSPFADLVKPKIDNTHKTAKSPANLKKSSSRLAKLNPIPSKMDNSSYSDLIYNSNEKFYIKKDDFITFSSINFMEHSSYITKINSQDSNTNNFKSQTTSKQTNEKKDKKYTENVLFPVSYLDTSQIKQAITGKKVHFNLIDSNNSSVKSNSLKPRTCLRNKSQFETDTQRKRRSSNQITEEYLDSLKRSGLANQNCRPIIKNTNTLKPLKFINFIDSK